jgi:hypothetical protein
MENEQLIQQLSKLDSFIYNPAEGTIKTVTGEVIAKMFFEQFYSFAEVQDFQRISCRIHVTEDRSNGDVLFIRRKSFSLEDMQFFAKQNSDFFPENMTLSVKGNNLLAECVEGCPAWHRQIIEKLSFCLKEGKIEYVLIKKSLE